MDDIQYTQYYIAFLDILGFKNLVNSSRTCEKIVHIYDFAQYRYETFFKSMDDVAKNIKMKIMSDSICLYIRADFPNALLYLMIYCVTFQCDLLHSEGLPLRGGITYGDMYVENDIIFGPALTEAYLLEEHNAKVPRIIIRKQTIDEGTREMAKENLDLVWKTVFRDDDAFYTLDYFLFLVFGRNNKALDQVKAVISNQLDTTIDDSIRQKYLYIEKNINRYLKG